MNVRLALRSGLMLGLALLPDARAEPPAMVKREINYLLDHVKASGCAFYRNGSWYDSNMAETHLRDKYEYLTFNNMINSAEDFITKAASESSLSGTAYAVKCRGTEAIASNLWLRSELAHYRAH